MTILTDDIIAERKVMGTGYMVLLWVLLIIGFLALNYYVEMNSRQFTIATFLWLMFTQFSTSLMRFIIGQYTLMDPKDGWLLNIVFTSILILCTMFFWVFNVPQ